MLSCKSKENHFNIREVEVPAELTQNLSYSATRANTLNAMARQLSMYPTLDAGAVGYGGKQTEQYARFKSLEKFATEEELIKLTQHNSGIVKGYAFWALCNKNSGTCRKILDDHTHDNTLIWMFAGCTRTTTYVNAFYLNCFAEKLSQDEIATYRSTIRNILGSKYNDFLY